jgi:hypothetical protein
MVCVVANEQNITEDVTVDQTAKLTAQMLLWFMEQILYHNLQLQQLAQQGQMVKHIAWHPARQHIVLLA